MSSDSNDELARARTRRARDRTFARSDAADQAGASTEQGDALARARESWALSQLRGAGTGPPDGHDTEPRDAPEEG